MRRGGHDGEGGSEWYGMIPGLVDNNNNNNDNNNNPPVWYGIIPG